MTEEIKQEVKEEPKVEVPEHSEIEQRAMSMGWRPKTEWQGTEDDFIDAKEFVRRKPLFDKIDSTTKRLRSVEETLNQLASHHQKVKELEYQRALKEMRLEKRAALKEGDTVVALALEDKMDELVEQRQLEVQQDVKIPAPQQGPSSEFLTWVKSNDWYLNDTAMHDFADGVAVSFIKRNELNGTKLTEEEVFSHVLDKVKKAYPERFENPDRQRASAVSSGDRSGKGVKSTYKLSQEEEEVARNFERQGIMTRAEYAKERQALKGDE